MNPVCYVKLTSWLRGDEVLDRVAAGCLFVDGGAATSRGPTVIGTNHLVRSNSCTTSVSYSSRAMPRT